MHPWIANTHTDANILPQTVFENLRKNLLRLSKQKNRFELSLTRAKSGQTDLVNSCLDDDEKSFDDDDEEEVKNDEIDEINEDVGRRAISYAEELNLAFMVKHKQKNFKEALKSVKSEGKMNEKINEEEVKKNCEEI